MPEIFFEMKKQGAFDRNLKLNNELQLIIIIRF